MRKYFDIELQHQTALEVKPFWKAINLGVKPFWTLRLQQHAGLESRLWCETVLTPNSSTKPFWKSNRLGSQSLGVNPLWTLKLHQQTGLESRLWCQSTKPVLNQHSGVKSFTFKLKHQTQRQSTLCCQTGVTFKPSTKPFWKSNRWREWSRGLLWHMF